MNLIYQYPVYDLSLNSLSTVIYVPSIQPILICWPSKFIKFLYLYFWILALGLYCRALIFTMAEVAPMAYSPIHNSPKRRRYTINISKRWLLITTLSFCSSYVMYSIRKYYKRFALWCTLITPSRNEVFLLYSWFMAWE